MNKNLNYINYYNLFVYIYLAWFFTMSWYTILMTSAWNMFSTGPNYIYHLNLIFTWQLMIPASHLVFLYNYFHPERHSMKNFKLIQFGALLTIISPVVGYTVSKMALELGKLF